MAGSGRILQKLDASLAARNFYEAHQLYRTLYFRYISQQKYEDLISLLFDGACRLLDNGEFASGFDLAKLLVEVLTVACKPVEAESLERIADVFKRLKHDETELVDRNSFIQSALAWSRKVSPIHQHGHPELHQGFAAVYWSEHNYCSARYHFLRSRDGQNCGLFLIEYHQQRGYPSEVDLFLAQAVLQFLCHKNESTASHVFRVYTEKHPQIASRPPFLLPLLNFLWLLLLCINTGSTAEKLKRFSSLVEQYQPSISRDDSFREYLDRIGQSYFGLPPPKRESTGGLFNNLLRGLIGSADSDSEEEVSSNGFLPNAAAVNSITSMPPQPQVKNLVTDELD